MNRLLLYTTVVATALSDSLAGCDLEVALLFDASSWFLSRARVTGLQVARAMHKLEKRARSVRTSVASFVDKPIPEVGLGGYGGNLLTEKQYKADWCWNMLMPAQENASSSLANTIGKMQTGYGFDARENHLEAMAHALVDSAMNWTADARKLLVVFTDAAPHANAEGLSAAEAVARFNAPVTCQGNITIGGFGAQQVPTEWPHYWSLKQDLYKEYATLVHKRVCMSANTEDDDERIQALEEDLREISWPSLSPFSTEVLIKDPATHCAYHEYPSYEEIATLFNNIHAELLVFVLDTEFSQVDFDKRLSPAWKGWREILSQGPMASVPTQMVAIDDFTLTDVSTLLEQYIARKIGPKSCGEDRPSTFGPMHVRTTFIKPASSN